MATWLGPAKKFFYDKTNMQVQFWARNLSSSASIEITPPRPLHLTNVSISVDFRDAFAPTSLSLSVVLADRRTSPRYTIGTLIAGQLNTLHIDVRLDQGVKYVLAVHGPNVLSILGYHTQSSDIGQLAPLPGVKNAFGPTPGTTISPSSNGGTNGLGWGIAPMPGGSSVANPLLPPSQLGAAENGPPLNGPNSSTRLMKPLRHRHADPSSVSVNPPSVSANSSLVSTNPPSVNTVSDGNAHAHAAKRMKNGDGTFTNRYQAAENELSGRLGQLNGTVVSGPNTNKRKSTAESEVVAGVVAGAVASGVKPNEGKLTADNDVTYPHRPLPPTSYAHANMTNASLTDGRPQTIPYNTPRLASQVPYSDQNIVSQTNQAGPSQYRLPLANHTRKDVNDNSQ
ncbi:hypothetical protein FB446DRAFT_706779 [Lentinula raphanica]|nr:hypothetical protein FB446DRAFT_706779 [Lentinula raphanica]